MNECAKVKRLLSRYLDKETNIEDTALVNSHVVTCAGCREELAELGWVKELVVNRERKALPAGYMVERVAEELGREAEEGFSWVDAIGKLARGFIPVPVAVIIASIAFLVIVTGTGRDYSFEEQLLSGTQTTTEVALGVILGA